MRLPIAPLALVLLVAAAPAPDPLLDKVIAGARAVTPTTIAFERTARTTSKDDKGNGETRVRVDRWDGAQLTPVSIDGKPPTPAQLAEIQKATAGRPVPGYHRVADFLKNGAVRVPDPQGRTVYRVTGLPKGTVNIGKDISANLVGEAVVDTSGPQPYVSRLRVYLPKPLSFFMVAKLDAYEQINEYRLGPGGKPSLFKALQSMSGAQFGKSGSTRTEATYNALR
jgi:hypothetical protein